jgi:hypothetical protein
LHPEDDDFDIIEYMDENNNDKWIAPCQQITALNESCLKQVGKEASRYLSTSVETYKIVFTFKDGSAMSCHYHKYAGQEKVGYLFTPWTITYGNYVYQTDDLHVGSLITQITQGKMLDQRYCSKAYAIYQMVETMRSQRHVIVTEQ